jgi:hypothetical protein
LPNLRFEESQEIDFRACCLNGFGILYELFAGVIVRNGRLLRRIVQCELKEDIFVA